MKGAPTCRHCAQQMVLLRHSPGEGSRVGKTLFECRSCFAVVTETVVVLQPENPAPSHAAHKP